MSYVPPHKRHSRAHQITAPETLAPNLCGDKLNVGPYRTTDPSWKIVYGDKVVYRWFAVGLEENDGKIPPSIALLPVNVEAILRQGKKPLALVNTCFLDDDGGRVRQEDLKKKPWTCIAERVMQDLIPCFEYVRSKIESGTLEHIRPSLVARVGKVLFLRNNYKPMDESKKELLSEKCLGYMNRMFYTSVPLSYSDNIANTIVPEINFKFEGVKDVYHVKLFDESRPDDIISCKCRIMNEENNSLVLYKMELNQIREMVCDISCLDTNLDLRVMLCSKRLFTAFTEEEEEMIKRLIKSAIIDPNVKGGLKWPLGKESCGDRYRVVGVWHTHYKSFSSPFMKLKVRDADRFAFSSSTGEVSKEIVLKLKGIASKLMEKKLEEDAAVVSDMLADAIKLLWEKFLHSS